MSFEQSEPVDEPPDPFADTGIEVTAANGFHALAPDFGDTEQTLVAGDDWGVQMQPDPAAREKTLPAQGPASNISESGGQGTASSGELGPLGKWAKEQFDETWAAASLGARIRKLTQAEMEDLRAAHPDVLSADADAGSRARLTLIEAFLAARRAPEE